MVRWKVRTETRQYAADSDLVRSCDDIGAGAAASMGRLCRAGDEPGRRASRCSHGGREE